MSRYERHFIAPKGLPAGASVRVGKLPKLDRVDFVGAGLNGYWDPEQSFNGSSTYRDLSGYGNNLTFAGAPAYDGSAGGCLGDGAGASVNHPLLTGNTNLTLSLWIYCVSNRVGQMILNGSGVNGFGLWQGLNDNSIAGNNVLVLLGGVSWNSKGAMPGLPGWRFFTLRQNASSGVELRSNGSYVGATANNALSPTNNFSMMLVDGSGTKYGISAAWQSYLSDSDDLTNFNATKARYGL